MSSPLRGGFFALGVALAPVSCAIEPRVVEERASATGGASTGWPRSSSGQGGKPSAEAGAAGGAGAASNQDCSPGTPQNAVIGAGFAFWGEQGRLSHAPLSGGRPTYLGGADVHAEVVAVDQGSVYAGSNQGITRVSLTNGTTSMIEGNASGVTAHGDYLYFVGPSGLVRVPKDGGMAEQLNASKTFSDVVADASGIYLSETLSNPGEDLLSLRAVRLDHTDMSQPLLDTSDPPTGALLSRGMALTEQFVFVANGGSIYRAMKRGGISRKMTIGSSRVTSLIADQKFAYWANCAGELRRMPIGGGPQVTLAAGQHSPVLAGVDEQAVYFIAGGIVSGAGGPWQLQSVAKIQ